MNKRSITLLIVSLMLVNPAQSSPSKITNYLMDEPLSMLDWGIYQISKDLGPQLFDDAGINYGRSFASYDWDQDRLNVSYVGYIKYKDIDKGKGLCKAIINNLRAFFGVDIKSGKLTPFSNLGRYFTHAGFARNAQPDNVSAEISNVIQLESRIMTSKSGEPPYSYVSLCEAPLLGTKVLYKDSPFDNSNK